MGDGPEVGRGKRRLCGRRGARFLEIVRLMFSPVSNVTPKPVDPNDIADGRKADSCLLRGTRTK